MIMVMVVAMLITEITAAPILPTDRHPSVVE